MPDFLADALTWPQNYQYTVAIETAMRLNMQPSVMLVRGKTAADGWAEYDKKLAMAWVILDRESCKECGQPLWICRSSNKDLMFSVRTDLCYASAEFEKWQDSKRAKNLKKGEKPYIMARMREEESPKPSRLDYLREQADE